MNENKDFNNDYDSLKDVTEFQNNMFNPGNYIGTGKVPPTVSAPGNAMPMAVVFFIFAAVALFMTYVFLTILSDVSDIIFLALIMLGLSVFCMVLGIKYLKKAKKYRSEKAAFENEYIDEETTDELWQRTCPKCGETHDIDYPKCPNCKYNYLE